MVKIETPRLLLRPIEESDAQDIYEYSCNPNVGITAGWKPHESIEETKEIMEQIFIRQKNIFGIVLKESNKLIGTIGLIQDPRRENPKAKMIGYALAQEEWGKGLMTEATKAVISYGFNEESLELISCTCYPDNQRSNRVIEKCGFHYEGCFRQCEVRYDGTLMDMKSFSITLQEWNKQNSNKKD
ncbi:GNAT family protein [uncultured Bacteroides sp.]|uniref:GNAT family N-acetyltransferase n=1 Tax=uncultured Bacteroides sp. TaxID=162156 RepID=UPI002AAA6867|nr:GNAT family protein [uncultured Bacteroides sp.]